METSSKAILGQIEAGGKDFILNLLSIYRLICGFLRISLIYSVTHESAVSLRAKTSAK